MHKLKSIHIKLSVEERLYESKVPIIGLTGGIASGKSSVSKFFSQLGLCVIDADQLVRKIYSTQQTLDLISKIAPNALKDSKINFPKLRQLFFSDLNVKDQIEKHIYTELPSFFIKELNSFNTPNFVIYDAALLFDKGLEQKVDTSLLVYTSFELQLERLMKRDSITRELAHKIISDQMSLEEKKLRCDFLIDNTGNLSQLEQNVHDCLNKLLTN